MSKLKTNMSRIKTGMLKIKSNWSESVLEEVVEARLFVPMRAIASSMLYCPAPLISRIAARIGCR